MPAAIEKRVDWGFLRYANCWEDADLLCAALRPKPACRILSIASGGDNAFRLLAEGAVVVAADLNPAQFACVELKAAAMRAMEREAFLAFVGIRPASDRPAVYAALRPALSAAARAFWDSHPGLLAGGVVHAGKFERYFRLFRTRVLPLIHRRGTVAALLEPRDGAARRVFYDRVWNNRRWRWLFRLFFSRRVMGRLGRDPEFFRYVGGSVADRILARAEYALTELPTHDNPYLRYILEGNFGSVVPPYLAPGVYERARAGLERLTLHLGGVEDAARAHRGPGFDGFNLSDIFEYLDPATCLDVYRALLESARPGARFAYWNMLAPRRAPDALRDRVTALDVEAAGLFRRDRAFFYSAFVVEEARA
jgi:S-adenosylmethionine-diacylglycerol 3-amino-3-carboxypropyl transferase